MEYPEKYTLEEIGPILFSTGTKYHEEPPAYSFSSRDLHVYPDSPEKIATHERLRVFVDKSRESGTVPLNEGGKFQQSIVVIGRVDGFGHSREFGKTIYLDTPHGFVLTEAGNPIQPLAVVGFVVEPHAITVRQIQGVKGAGDTLKKAGRWEKALVSLVENAAISFKIPTVGIITAEMNGWVGSRIRLGTMNRDAARLRYDGTAKRMGYTWNEIKQTWYKDVN